MNRRKPQKRKRLRQLAALLLCLPLLLAGLSLAGNAKAETKNVRVGWYESAFNHTDAFGRRSGYAYEYQMKIAAYTEWNFEYVEGSWSELLQLLIDGQIDLMSDISYTEERAKNMLYSSAPMGAEDYYLFVSTANQEISALDYSTLNGKRVGVNKASYQAECLKEWMERYSVTCKVIELSCAEAESIRMLTDGELDAYVTVDSFAENAAGAAAPPRPVCKIGSSDFYFAVSQSRPDLLAELDFAMNRIQEENRYYKQELFEKHLRSAGANALLSAEEKEWIEKHGAIRVGYQDNYLAFCAADPETGELTGALKDYLEYAQESIINASVRFEATAYPTAQDAIEALRRGEVDCVFPANLSAGDGENLGLFITPSLMRTDVFAVVRQADRQRFLQQKYVVAAVNEGNPNYESCLHDSFPGWRYVVYPTTSDCLKAVSQGVADCVLISSYRYNNIARQCERERLTTVDTSAKIDYCFAVSAGNSVLYSILARVADLVPDSAINTALARYITEDAKVSLRDILADNIWPIAVTVGTIVVIILLLMIRSMKAQVKAARLISATETDALTGLYNRDFFLQYAARMHREKPDMPMDAIEINIDRFHSVNALKGRQFGDQLLRALGEEIHAFADETRGIAGRFEADRFDIYCAHREDYSALYERLQKKIDSLAPSSGMRFRMGVMPWQKDMEVIQMFDKARTACALAKEQYRSHQIIYDTAMQEREDYEQRLLNDLQRALDNYEFEVYYQPQYDIQCDPPKLVSAEALVRWNHPDLGMIPPNDFIPLVERHGKIGDVDRFVWSETARQIARWRDIYDVSFPVSVNLSRMDVFDPALEAILDKLLSFNGLAQGSLMLEVTESAYTDNADQVISVVESLRRKGYVVEMDDFGSGYSSLNMLSSMPVDVLKMDRAFIRRLGQQEKDNSLVALILGIAKSLKIPVVAEGVENEEQLRQLRRLGCPLVQGYYFSKPLPAKEFEEKVIREIGKTAEKRDNASCIH